MDNLDFYTPPWWVTVSGAGTSHAEVESWEDDYTRSRSGKSTTYTSVDSIIGRTKSCRELDKGKW